MNRLARALVGRLSGKYPFLMCWFNYILTFNILAKCTVVSSCSEKSIGLFRLRAFKVLLLWRTVANAITLSVVYNRRFKPINFNKKIEL